MKKQKANESGRSMVEMLGTLAIIGVLSIGAIGGYRWAMDKMAANDILNEIKKRAVVASQQRILGNPLDLTEFDDTIRDTYAVIAQDNYKGSYSAFSLAVEGISQAVCNKLIKMDWVLPVVKKLNDADFSDSSACAETNTVLYVFNNDLDMGKLDNAGTGDTDTPDEEPSLPKCGPNEYVDVNTGECKEDMYCPVGEVSISSPMYDGCKPCPTKIGESVYLDSNWEDSCSKCPGTQTTQNEYYSAKCVYCPKPRIVCGSTCCAENEACQIYSGYFTCVPSICKKDADCTEAATPLCDTYTGTCFAGCRDNSDCALGQFCDLDVSTTGYSCTQKPGQGTCKQASSRSAGIFTASSEVMSWWSAKNFCQTLGMHLISPDKLNCYKSGTNTPAVEGDYCCQKGMTCDWEYDWQSGSYILKGTVSDELLMLQTHLGTNSGVWTAKLGNSCTAWGLQLDHGGARQYNRNGFINGLSDYAFYALCEN